MSYRNRPKVTGKLNRLRKGVKSKDLKKYGDWVKVKSRFEGKCTLCHEEFGEGLDMMYNKNRMPGAKMAHISCLLRKVEEESAN
jgi:cytochrome c